MTGDTQTCRQCLVKTKIHVTISEELCGHIVSKNQASAAILYYISIHIPTWCDKYTNFRWKQLIFMTVLNSVSIQS